MALDEASKGLMRIDYEETDLTVDAIGDKFGVTGSYVSRCARRGGWKMRSERPGVLARAAAADAAGRARIARRLCTVINKKIDQMEKNMTSGEHSSADLERDAKTIGSMIGGLQKVVPGPDEDKVSKPDAERSTSVETADEVERLQREIIERFERIEKRREAEGGSV